MEAATLACPLRIGAEALLELSMRAAAKAGAPRAEYVTGFRRQSSDGGKTLRSVKSRIGRTAKTPVL
jgi:hypothetical protein